VIDWIKTKIKKILEHENKDEIETSEEIANEFDTITNLTQNDFIQATKCVKPSSKREGFATGIIFMHQ
jgi:hypothetical protein